MLGLGNNLVSGSDGHRPRFSLQGDGTGDAMNIGDIQSIIRGSFTINCWMRLDDSTPSAETAAGGHHIDGSNYLYYGQITTSGNTNFAFGADGTGINFSGSADLDGSGTGLSGNSQSDWFMVTLIATLDSGSSDSTFAYYTNANAISTNLTLAKAKHTAFATGGNVFAFGARNDGGTISRSIDGNIAECAIWNTALDADAVTALYNSGASLNPMINSGNYDNSSALVRYYNFDQGSGTSITDQTTNANGTLVGNPTYSEDHPGS